MQTFIYGLLLAFVSAISVVAFKHPMGFARLFPYLLGVSTSIFIGISIWHVAVEITWTSLMPYVAQDLLADAESLKGALLLPYLWVSIWYFAVVAFLWVNLRLPTFLQIAERNDTSSQKETTL